MMSVSREVSNICKGFAILIIILCHVGNYFTRILTPLGGGWSIHFFNIVRIWSIMFITWDFSFILHR